MHATTVRFGDQLWERLEREARAEGVSVAQFVRDAALLRVAVLAGRRGDADALATLQDLAAQAPRRAHAAPAEVAADPARVAAVRATGLLDDARVHEPLDRLTDLVRRVLNVPVALVSLVDADRQYFPSCPGLGEPWAGQRETPLSHSFCQHVVTDREPLVVSDAREHPLLKDNLAVRDLDVIAYAGVPLTGEDGHVLGSLCAIDSQPRAWSADQVDLLRALAESTMVEIARAGGGAGAGAGARAA